MISSLFFVSLPSQNGIVAMRLLITTILLTFGLSLSAQHDDLPALYQQIDEAIARSPEYVARHEARISSVRAAYEQAGDEAERFKQAFSLYELYRAYLNDSALVFLERAEESARLQGRMDLVGNCLALKAFQCSTVGLYNEALMILDTVHQQQLDSVGLKNYYMARMHVYGELGYYTKIKAMGEEFFKQRSKYRELFYAVVDHHSKDYLMSRISELKDQQQLEQARRLCDEWMGRMQPGTHEEAIACYYRFLVSDKEEEQKYWLARSVLYDICNAVMDQASLLSLAELLNAEGDFDRSYRYIRFTWDCNNHFNTRMRSWQISPILTVIEKNYQEAVEHNTRVLWLSVVSMSVLALLLLGVLFFLYRRNKQLAVARNALHEANSRLATLNGELKGANDLLSAKNDQFVVLNSQLSESNRVKEEYIGRFMSLCSQYIDKLDDYRKMVNKKMKNKELEDLFRLSRSTELKEKELEELFQNFDSVFLNLFPGFVSDFNALLQPDTQVHPKEENRLTTEIRIFALIRLGIEDSSKIAEFLHYSVNTIYNYRARIKNGAIDNRESFERRVKQLGLIQ